MSHFLQLLSPFLRKFRTSTPSPTRPSSASELENNEDENENDAAENELEPKKPKTCETDPPTNEKIRLSKATKGIYDL